ncbi:TonB-dependent receptor [Acinetobacter pittii]|uniref:TonB-dependent receptor n=1 Tax=Acinetobacter TaxID=469 RepID=UPI000CE376D6|nr:MULTISPECIES: TonB-dependent receptor [Acinetobacter]AZB90476.1 TonB-dependent receptor [Acinetobacter pittii]PPC03437.1 TonB-dependent siderophore receptor [Acinetobacter pittii]QVR69358.1 TonB-dependent receptor [Acinetobacter sp. BHS4]WPP78677.1 TonB-dependent receptor [Acinetobacter pittii]
MRLSHFSLCFLTTAICTHLYADDSIKITTESQNAEAKLPTIVITATRTPKSIAEIAGTVQTISADEIAQQAGPGRKVADVLTQLVPSLAPSSGTSSNYGQTMRGRNVLVMIDGVSQTGSRDVARQLNSISPNMIDHIEIVSGATSIYGSGATGGIINIITKRADKSKPVSFQTKLGVTSADNFRSDSLAYQVGQTASFSNDKVDGFLGIDYTNRGSQFDGNGDRISLSPWQGSTMDTDTIDVNGRVNFNLTDNQTLSFGTQYYKDEQDTEYGPDYSYLLTKTDPSYKAVKGWSLDNQPFTERYAFNTQYQNQDFLGQVLNVEAYYRKEKSRFVPYGYSADGVSVKQSQSNVDYAGIRSTLQSDLIVADRDLKLTYGLDYDWEKDHQWADYYTPSNNGLVYTPTGEKQGSGPDTEIQNIGTFIQGDYAVTDQLNIQAGVRYQYVQADTDSYLTARKPYTLMAADSTDSDKFLFNLGAVYKLTDAQQVYANFSQGYSYPDVQRVLRDVAAYTLTTSGIAPITVNSYELGWRLNQDKGLNLGLTGFYNTSDKVVQFNSDRSVNVVDTDQRIYGAEATVSYPFMENYKVGGTLGYTRGQYKDGANNWHELNAFAVSPMKGTLFAEWNNTAGYGVRAQMLAIKGTDKAYKDDLELKSAGLSDSNSAAEIKGYTTMDVLAHFPVAKGRVDFGVYNLWGNQYKTVFAQQAAVTNANSLLAIPAEGRTFVLSYTINY